MSPTNSKISQEAVRNQARRTAFGILVYVATGILQPTVIDFLRIHNCLGRKWLLLPTLANTLGMALCGLLVSSHQWQTFQSFLKSNARLRQCILLTATVDLISGMCLTGGIMLTGGAVFVVLYNSCPAWTAILSRTLLKKHLTWMQVSGVLLVCIGILINVWGSQHQAHTQEDMMEKRSQDLGAPYKILVGSVIVLVGSLLHSLMFVMSEWSLRSSLETSGDDEIVSGEIWSCCLGSLESIFMSIWVIVGISLYGLNDQNMDEDSVGTNNNVSSFLKGFFALVVIDTIHAAAFFSLLKKLGAVPSALLKGVQTIAVVGISAMAFCGTEESQCLTSMKAISIVTVLSGVICYGLGSNKDKKNEEIVRDTVTHSELEKNQEMKSLIFS